MLIPFFHVLSNSVDEEGFEIISTGPSKLELDKINSNYLKSIKKIFLTKCLTCHGVNVSLPWYYQILGAKQLMNNDMSEAKRHIDMSYDFPFRGHGSPIDDLNALKRTIRKGDMPPVKYRIMHWNSKLTETEVREINDWIEKSQKVLNKK
jgi:hypothetical protein